ncbi:MAG: M20/M25/M40 family metallo-hydrolase [Christensenellales bacterium]
MGLYILYAILAAIGLLLIIMVIRTLLARPKKTEISYTPSEVNEDEIVDILVNAVRIPTVTKYKEGDDQSSFLRYHEFLKTTFPEIFSRAEVTVINSYSLIIKIDGSDATLAPGCFLAHQDVVPATPEGWEVDPFGGVIKDGYIYGRGSQDMKSQMMTALYGLELLLREGKEPVRTIYYCFGHDEEATGKDGARHIVEYLKEKGVRFDFVLDEGGTIIDGKMLGVNGKIALIGTCEKGYSDFILTSVKDGGHASNPKKKSSVDAIADAIHDLRRSPMKTYWSKPLKEMFDTIAPYMNPLYKFLFVNRPVLSPLLKFALSSMNSMTNSILRTTFAFTQMQGSDAPNVIPVKATAIVNTRINVGQTQQEVKDYIQKVVGDEIKVETYGFGFDPTPVSKTRDSVIYDTLVKSLEEIFTGFVVAPYPFIAATDAKYYYAISDNVYRFTPFEMTLDDQKRLHALNERCEIKSLTKATQFFRRFIENTCY